MMDKVLSFLALVFASFVGLLTFTGTVFAAGAVAPADGSLLDLAKPILDAVMNGQGWLAAALALVFAVTLARRYGAKHAPFLGGKLGGALLNLLLAFGGAAATALAAGSTASLGLALAALKVAIAAASGYELVKELLAPMLRSLVDRIPSAKVRSILHAGLDVALWAFENRAKKAVARAEAAGQDAVDAKPAGGIESVTGAPRSFP